MHNVAYYADLYHPRDEFLFVNLVKSAFNVQEQRKRHLFLALRTLHFCNKLGHYV